MHREQVNYCLELSLGKTTGISSWKFNINVEYMTEMNIVVLFTTNENVLLTILNLINQKLLHNILRLIETKINITPIRD